MLIDGVSGNTSSSIYQDTTGTFDGHGRLAAYALGLKLWDAVIRAFKSMKSQITANTQQINDNISATAVRFDTVSDRCLKSR